MTIPRRSWLLGLLALTVACAPAAPAVAPTTAPAPTAAAAKPAASGAAIKLAMILPGPTFSGYVAVQVPENASKIYTDEAVRQMFASAVIRNEVPVEEQLAILPFSLTDLAGFRIVRAAAVGAALADLTKQLIDTPTAHEACALFHLVVSGEIEHLARG